MLARAAQREQRAQLRRKRTRGGPANARRRARRSASGAPRGCDARLASRLSFGLTAPLTVTAPVTAIVQSRMAGVPAEQAPPDGAGPRRSRREDAETGHAAAGATPRAQESE